MELKVETFAKHPHWPAIQNVLKRLHQAGYVAYLAGGCVRDALLGKTAKDFDVATSALPDEVEELFEKTVAVGKAFGVILVMEQGVPVEVTTFRVDGDYRDGRRPESVEFRSAEEDAERRDFTVNALFYDLQKRKVVDFVDGLRDLEARTIRAVGEPNKRFTEDKLRILRAVRFACSLDFAIDGKTFQGIKQLAPEIHMVSQERITEELKKICESNDPAKGFLLLRETGLDKKLFPEFSELFEKDWQRILRGLVYLGEAPGFAIVFACIGLMLNDVGTMKNLLRRLKVSGDIESTVNFILQNAADMRRFNTESLLLLSDTKGLRLLEVLDAINYADKQDGTRLAKFIERYLTIADAEGKLPSHFLTGNDLLLAGFQKGPRLGEILREARLLQLEKKIKSRDEALAWLRTQKI